MLRQGGIDLQPLFALLFFCALGIFVGVVAIGRIGPAYGPAFALRAFVRAGGIARWRRAAAVLFAGARFLWRALLSGGSSRCGCAGVVVAPSPQ